MSQLTFEVYEDAEGKHRWRLRHENGNVVADSGEGYASRQKVIEAARSVREHAGEAPIEELD